MPDHRLIVARGFRIAGLGLGAPSLLATIGFGIGAFMAAAHPPDPKPEYLDVQTYGLVGLLSNAATGVGGVLSFVNALAGWVFGLLAALALAAALFCGLLYLVGRGLKASAGWARIVGVLLMALLSLNALLAFAIVRGPARLVDAALLAALAYVLWALVWRFGKPIASGPPAD